MSTKNLSDEELFNLFALKGDSSAYEKIYSRYFSVLAKYAAWSLEDSESAKDLVQSILLKLYEKPELFDSSQSLKVWLFSVLKNRIKNEWRNKNTRQKILDKIPFENTENEEEPDRNHQFQKIQSAINHLSEKHKEIFLLKYSSNLTIPEISESMNISVGTVKSRLFYSVRAIRQHINENKINQE